MSVEQKKQKGAEDVLHLLRSATLMTTVVTHYPFRRSCQLRHCELLGDGIDGPLGYRILSNHIWRKIPNTAFCFYLKRLSCLGPFLPVVGVGVRAAILPHVCRHVSLPRTLETSSDGCSAFVTAVHPVIQRFHKESAVVQAASN